MQAVLLAGGRGNRLTDITKDNNKCMLLVNNKPIIQYNLDHLYNAGIKAVVIVVGYRAEDIINAFGTDYKGMKLKYVLQKDQKGIIHAIECARHEIKGDFLLSLADEIHINPNLKQMLYEFMNRNVTAICGIVQQPDTEKIKQTYAIIPHDRKIIRLIEKPEVPLNNLMGTGFCAMKYELLSLLEKTPVNQSRNEKELPDWIQCAIDRGGNVEYFKVSDAYVNINYKEDLEETELIIKRLQGTQGQT